MKRVFLIVLAVFALTPVMMAGNKKKKAAKEKTTTVDSTEIHWMSLDDVQVAMKKEPKKVYMDIYTDWCGWCKVMERKTFSNKNVIKYINKNFYPVRFNAELKDSINFMGKMYGFVPAQRANEFAIQLLQGRMSYPTSVILEENFQNPAAIPGYLDVPTMEKILTYIATNTYKTVKYPDYEKDFKSTWMDGEANTQEALPPGH